MLPKSSISVAANELRTLLKNEIDDIEDLNQIKIGPPKVTFEDIEKKDDKNHLNLFFYNVSYDGYPADGLSENPFYVRLFCLITAVGGKKSNPSPGENDLRLIGEVMHVLHEHPFISVRNGDNSEIAQLQIVPHSLTLDNLNHIWSTQNDTPYHLSIAYEMSLAPVPLTEAVDRSPLVGEIGIKVREDMIKEQLPAGGFGIETLSPVVPKITVNVNNPDWAPHICFVDGENNCLAYTLLIPKSEIPAPGLLELDVLIAGDPSEQVDLVWETWNYTTGWKRSESSQTETIQIETIDEAKLSFPLAPGSTIKIDLPLKDKGQATLYAERTRQREDGTIVTIRSNPLLVTVYEEVP